MKPLQDRLIVKKIEEKQESTIVVVGNNKTHVIGDVIAVGDGYHMENGTVVPLDVVVGDRVMFPVHAGAVVTINGEQLLIIKESDVYAVLEEE